jgi:hypothetical protein
MGLSQEAGAGMSRLRRVLVLALLGLFGFSPAFAQEGATYVLVISGVGGEPQYSKSFHAAGAAIYEAATVKYGVPKANATFLAERAEDPGVTGVARKDAVEQLLTSLAPKTTPADLVFIVIIGHGSFLNNESKVNLVGPDMTAQDFARLLQPIKARIAFVNTTEASGEFARILAGPNRAIITATKSGMERNQAVFGEYFAKAFAADVADTDKDGRLSLLEAYEYARLETKRYYEGQNRIMTEHAQIEDTGKGTPSPEGGPDKPNGALAARIVLGAFGTAASGAPANASPQLRALYTEKAQLEERIADLKARKDSMNPAQYEAELEKLLLELAAKTQAIRRMEGGR